jgi:hypothetical protein
MKYIYLLILIILNSCIQNAKKESTNLKTSNITTEINQGLSYRDTIAIDYSKHEKLLTVLKLLPESTMSSWEWSKNDREKTVKCIEQNNFIIDSTKLYHNINYIKPNTMCIQVVDGLWTLSLYEFQKNHYFIVTNDIVGDGNDVQTFNFINNEIVPLKMINWFDGAGYKLLKQNDIKECNQLIEDNLISFSYNFSHKNEIKISSWLTKYETHSCLKGNTLKYKLNKQNKTFDVVDVYWENETPVDSTKTTIPTKDSRSIQELMRLTKTQAINKYGAPSFIEQFILDDEVGDFRNNITDKFTQKERENDSILIDELTWEMDKDNWITAWYQSQQVNPTPKSIYVWKKGSEF